ncbi:MAG: acyltransferase [Lachnospiraceae bacterium]|nr:acyltransferase [Lachnospiraceae bacterium]
MKERRNEYDLMRAISALAIVLFHYSYAFVQYNVGGEHIDFMMHANGTWGAIFVSLFFILSGSSLYYNWNDRMLSFTGKGGVLDFYKKRFLSIFPMFYLGWAICYVMTVISFDGIRNWGGPYRRLFMTLFGIDGYFLYKGLNYYLIGEWFLGAIIMLYVLYPLLQWCMKKIPVIATIIVVLLFALNTSRRYLPFMSGYNAWVQISDNISIITCLLSFWTGMLLGSFGRRIIKTYTALISLALALIMLLLPLPVNTLIITPILAVCFYIVLSYLSMLLDRKLKNRKTYDGIVGFYSRFSYPIFLVHHVTIQKMLTLFSGREMSYVGSIGYFFVTLAVISILAFVLSKLTDLMLKTVKRLLPDKQ